MNKNTIYIAIALIVLIVLGLAVILWKKDHTKENLCLCNGPQLVSRCKPYNLYSDLHIDVNTPPANPGPPPLKMPYDVLQYGYRKTRPDCI